MAYHQSTSQGDPSTVTVTLNDESDGHLQHDVATVRLKLKKPKSLKKVNWTEETIDNENMDKKKSKCCCVYNKPKLPNESSSSEDEDECEHCQGHVEKKKKTAKENPPPESPPQSVIAA